LKTAYLILVHNNPQQLSRLIGRIDFPGVDIFIHIDRKVAFEPFLFLLARKNVFLIAKSVEVSWGAYSIVQASVNGFEQIIASGNQYEIIHLISGQDYPIKKNQEIQDFFQANPGKSYMQFLDVATDWKEAIPRIEHYYLTNYKFIGRYQIERIIRNLLPKRKMPQGLVAVGRSQWLSIRLEHIKYILQYFQDHPDVVRFFKFTWAPDEFVFQTILYASIHQSEMVNDSKRYIDWSIGNANPKSLNINDKDAIQNSTDFFARKFNHDNIVLDWIDANLLS
jgi:hypothetical protein